MEKKLRSNGDGRDCINVSYCNKTYPAHRIIWEMFNGPIAEGMVIDHLNGDAWDNRLANLACKTRRENNQNKKNDQIILLDLQVLNGGLSTD